MTNKTHKQDLKHYEEVEKKKESTYICDYPYTGKGLCGGVISYNKEFQTWCCNKCDSIITEEHKNKLSRIY